MKSRQAKRRRPVRVRPLPRRAADLFDNTAEQYLTRTAITALKRLLGRDVLTDDKLRMLNELCVPAEESSPAGALATRRRHFASIAKTAAALLADLDAFRQDTSLASNLGANLDLEAPYRRTSLSTDPNGVSHLRRGLQVLDALWSGIAALRRTALDMTEPAGKRGQPADLPRLVAVLGISLWWRRHLGNSITLSREGAFARTLEIILPCLGYESPSDMVPVIRAAQRQWKFRATREFPGFR